MQNVEIPHTNDSTPRQCVPSYVLTFYGFMREAFRWRMNSVETGSHHPHTSWSETKLTSEGIRPLRKLLECLPICVISEVNGEVRG
jgi:hypothetical protein